jgi:hypothetical protein
MARLTTQFLAAVVLFLSAQAALAETPAEAAIRWGLLGSWRTDCSVPASRDDVVNIYVVRGGRLFHDRSWGDGTDSSVVSSAVIRPDGTLDVLIIFTSLSQTRENLYKKAPDGRLIPLMSKNVDKDEYTIKDGKAVSTGKPLAPLRHCSGS